MNESYSWSAPVYSPVDGEIIEASDGRLDQQNLILALELVMVFVMGVFQSQKAREDLRVFAGNYVVIASEDFYILLAHLRNGSLRVASGDRIIRGQQIASVGNSGNSAAPHLHLQVNDGRNLLDSKIKEFGFTRYDRWTGKSWETTLGMAPVKGDLIRFYD